MELSLDSIKDKHKGKIGVVIVLGPSLKDNLSDLEELNDNDDVIYFTCNMFDKMINIKSNYWLVCAPMKEMYINTAYERINDHGATFLFASRIPGFSKESAKEKLSVDYIPVSDVANDPNGLQQNFAKYTNDNTYGPVDTVLLHLIALSVMSGCKKTYICGADLNYSKGYVKNGVHVIGERIGPLNMNSAARDRTVNYVKTMKESANKIGSEIYTLNKTSPLSSVLDVKTIVELKKDISNE